MCFHHPHSEAPMGALLEDQLSGIQKVGRKYMVKIYNEALRIYDIYL